MIGPSDNGKLERRHHFVRLGLRGVDRLLDGVQVVLADGQVDRLRADAEGDVHLLAQQLRGPSSALRHGHAQRVEVHAFVAGGIPLDAREVGRLLEARVQLLESALELGRILHQGARDQGQRVRTELQRGGRHPFGPT